MTPLVGSLGRAVALALAVTVGTTLVLVLGTTAVTAVARGVQTWLARNSGVSLDIVANGKTVHARNLDSQGVQALAKVLAAAGD